MKKIGLVLAYKGVNYGMLLQAYATQNVIERLGYETEILDYTRVGYKKIRKTPYLAVYFVNEILKKIKNKNKNIYCDELHLNNVKQRKEVSNKFINDRLKNRIKCMGIDELEKRALLYNGVVVGSDQIWPPDCAFGNFTTLRFVPDNVTKISYATSLGVSEYPFWCKSSAKNFWKRINHLSVREEQGKRIITDICDLPVKVVVDPTYLLTKEQWCELIPNESIVDGDYILCYFLGGTKEHKLLARKYADNAGLKIVTILSTESYSDIDESFADKVITGVGPDKFINLVRNAKIVMTDSFHGVAFSVINNKQFYVFYRTLVNSHNSRNSRIDNILNMWNLQDRLVLNNADVDDFNNELIDYDIVNKKIEEKRAESLEFLSNALGDCR